MGCWGRVVMASGWKSKRWGFEPGTSKQLLKPGCLDNNYQPWCAFHAKYCEAYFKKIYVKETCQDFLAEHGLLTFEKPAC